MSSGPVGLDVKEYVYGYFPFSPSVPGIYVISGRANWWITRVQLFMGANAGILALDPGLAIPVAANGCLILEPNGAQKSRVEVSGVGARLIIEYWFQALAGVQLQQIPIDVVPPP